MVTQIAEHIKHAHTVIDTQVKFLHFTILHSTSAHPEQRRQAQDGGQAEQVEREEVACAMARTGSHHR